MIDSSFQKRWQAVWDRYQDLEQKMGQGDLKPQDYIVCAKEHARLAPVAEHIAQLRSLCAQRLEAQAWRETETDTETLGYIDGELRGIDEKIKNQEYTLKIALLPKDEADEKGAILEIRAGAGGQEASLFAEDLLRMYQKFSQAQRWKLETMNHAVTDSGGIREVSVSITGSNVFRDLKFESGVHRVQRVPTTESGGRIHTSTATVAVLPEAEEVDVHIDEKDVRVDVFRSSGPGGQSVNTTDSAVRLTHIPTGLVVQQQDEKSQHKNKAKAFKVLRARLYDLQRQELAMQRASDRRQQVGTGDRSERIRTYNFPQNRVTDHRIKESFSLSSILEGEGLQTVINALQTHHNAALLAQSDDDFLSND